MSASQSPTPGLKLLPRVPPSDEQLCRDFLSGEPAAFGELVRRHQDLVYRLVRRYATSADDGRELAQRAFLQAFEAARRTLPRLKKRSDDDVPFRAWLLRIAINIGKNHARDAGRWAWAPVESLERQGSGHQSATEQLELAEQQQQTRRAVLQLPKRQREVFGLRIDGGLSFAEVAAALGISEAIAKSHFHYAVKRLRDEVMRDQREPS